MGTTKNPSDVHSRGGRGGFRALDKVRNRVADLSGLVSEMYKIAAAREMPEQGRS